MASSSGGIGRSLRHSSRNASPLPLPVQVQANGVGDVQRQQQKIEHTAKEAVTVGDGKWREPPMRAPVPSFMDHKGLERLGVLEGMMPLGSAPSAKQKARVRADNLRRSLQSRQLEEARSTPDRATPAENTRSSSAGLQQETSRKTTTTAADGDDTETIALPVSSDPPPRQTDIISWRNTQPSSSPRTSPLPPPARPVTPPENIISSQQPDSPSSAPYVSLRYSIPTASPFSEAVRIAKEEGHIHLYKTLADLHVATSFDPELLNLAKLRAQPNASPAITARFNEKVKSFKRHWRAQQSKDESDSPAITLKTTMAPSRPDSSGSGKHQNLSPRFSIKPKLGRPSSATTNSLFSPKRTRQSRARAAAAAAAAATATTATAPTMASPPKAQRLSPLKVGVAREDSEETITVPSPTVSLPPVTRSIEMQDAAHKPPRRSSSSSLSSVDEVVVHQPPPTLGSYRRRANLKRTSEDAGYDADHPDTEIESRRKRLRQSIMLDQDVPLQESNVRIHLRLNPNEVPKIPTTASVAAKATTAAAIARNGSSQFMTQLTLTNTEGFGVGLAGTSRPVTPPTGLGRPPRKQQAKPPTMAARVKISPIKQKKGTVTAGVIRPEPKRQASLPPAEDDSSDSDNNDFCSACGGAGFLVCCDGCDRSFHFTCLDPPINQDAPLDEPWFCYICQARRGPPMRSQRGLFSDLFRRLQSQNPVSFQLPSHIRNFFEGVKTGTNGEYVDDLTTVKTKARGGDNEADSRRLRDNKDQPILCCYCKKSALENREIITCDYCSNHWHLDCLSPPLANVPHRFQNPRPAWMCPLHVEQDLRNYDPVAKTCVRPDNVARRHRLRRPKHPKIVDTALSRGSVNNGIIELMDDSDSASDFTELSDNEGVELRVPRQGIVLDFIDKVKARRIDEMQNAAHRAAAAQLEAASLRKQNEEEFAQALRRRSIAERRMALNLTQFQEGNSELHISELEIENLLWLLEAEAPSEVIESMMQDESAARSQGLSQSRKTTSATPATGASTGTSNRQLQPPPSPPASSDPQDVSTLSARNREILLRLQSQITKRLAECGYDGRI